MMKQIYLLILAATFSGCGLGGGNHEQIAQEVCECMRPLSESYSSMKDALDARDSSALQRFAEEMETVNEQVGDCAGRIEERYGPLEGKREEQVKAAMQKICPEVIEILNEAENELMQ